MSLRKVSNKLNKNLISFLGLFQFSVENAYKVRNLILFLIDSLIINCLKPYINVVQIGTPTYGKYQASVTLYDSENFSNQNVNRSHSYAMQPLVLKTLNVNGVTDYYNGINPDYEYEERAFDMGQVGDLNEPMLNFTLDIIDSRISLDLKTELFEYIDYNLKFDFLEREMYIDNKEIGKFYEK